MIPHLDKNAEILLLIGRDAVDAVEAHHILEQRLGSHNQPFAQKLKMGWVIVGETCLDGAHYPSTVNAMKTFVQQDGRPSILEPCDNSIHISEKLSTSLFKLEPDDNRQGMSIEDKKFMRLMSDEIQQDENQNWTAPLPFKESRPLLPNNRLQALNRARAFDISLPDDASRSIRPEKLNQSQWLIGPTQFLCKKNTIDSETEGDEFPLILPEEDREVRVAKTLVTKLAIGSKRFERFSQWKILVSAIQTLRCFIIKQTNRQDSSKTDSLQDAHNLVIGTVQREIFNVEYSALMNKQKLPANTVDEEDNFHTSFVMFQFKSNCKTTKPNTVQSN
ncbi:unnamed protein product [Mytilus edulis]|uniref:Uncharacterized protein n=1 Tax=Mytilus edulis TaxID=6550 RepID=A0A8S3R538_MYTED|nr:unnamed protein product [Mytilus edulis]